MDWLETHDLFVMGELLTLTDIQVHIQGNLVAQLITNTT